MYGNGIVVPFGGSYRQGGGYEEVPRTLVTFCTLIWVGCLVIKIHQALSYMLDSSTEINE